MSKRVTDEQLVQDFYLGHSIPTISYFRRVDELVINVAIRNAVSVKVVKT